jgi:hypothetical protein
MANYESLVDGFTKNRSFLFAEIAQEDYRDCKTISTKNHRSINKKVVDLKQHLKLKLFFYKITKKVLQFMSGG